jgi:hypothetical protein
LFTVNQKHKDLLSKLSLLSLVEPSKEEVSKMFEDSINVLERDPSSDTFKYIIVFATILSVSLGVA